MNKLFIYEIKNALSNIFAIIFGVAFPIMLTMLIYTGYKEEIPAAYLGEFAMEVFIANMLLIPLALVFIGFAALLSQETEKDITTRMALFGINETHQLRAKLVAQAISLILSLALYWVVLVPTLNLSFSNFGGIALLFALVLLFAIIIFFLAYAIVLLARKFSITYGITMTLYFAIMILSGMMGVSASSFPQPVQVIANLLPTKQIVSIMPNLVRGETVNFAPLIQSFIFFSACSALTYMIGIRKHKRDLH